jgi:hypothetical protein
MARKDRCNFRGTRARLVNDPPRRRHSLQSRSHARRSLGEAQDQNRLPRANYKGGGGGTVLFTAHYPRMHPSDFGVRTLDG